MRNKRIDIKCLTCNLIIKNVTKKRKFCSQRCAYIFRYIPHPTKIIYKKCSYCAKKKRIKLYHNCYKNHFCSRVHYILFLKAKAFYKYCEICNKKFYCQPSQVKYRNRKHCSRTCYLKAQALKVEENRIKNKFTKHQIDRCLRYSKEAINWRKKIFKRDNYTCQVCNARGVYIEADHIKPWAFFPKLRFKLSNGRTLCRLCHNKTKISAKAMKILYEA